MNLTEESQMSALPPERVATRPGTGGVAEKRRRIYQRHLLLFLGVNAALVAVDMYTSPGLQWAHFPAAPWVLLFVLHTVGLKSRGYSFVEMLVPPRQPPVREVYDVPLDYELVRSRQLRDGIVSAAAALRDSHADVAEQAVAAADELSEAMEQLAASTRGAGDSAAERARRVTPEAQAALEALDRLHQELIRVEVLEQDADGVPVEPVREGARALRQAVS